MKRLNKYPLRYILHIFQFGTSLRYLTVLSLLSLSTSVCAQSFETKLKEWAANYTRTDCYIKSSTLASCTVNKEEENIRIVLGGGFQEQFFTPEVVDDVYEQVKSLLPHDQRHFDLCIETDNRPIEELIPNFLRHGKKDADRQLSDIYHGAPWVKNISRPYTPTHGLENNHIALWQSHGRYYKTDKREWTWQRPRLYCTTEDLFSQTFVVPFIIPMLQNAGANVFTPRERDYQTHEVIVDNDQPNRHGSYIEVFRRQKNAKWQTTSRPGFAHLKDIYEPNDSPFTDGTARSVSTTSSSKEEGFAQWTPDIPEEGRYAVYVAYQSFPNSVTDATYTVYHKGGMTEFHVNQQMGGGIWVYLGSFEFDAGTHDYGMVRLSTHSNQQGIITADAVRFGGGMGNIVPASYTASIAPSGLPRWAEAAKYSIQWMGFPYSIHTEPFGTNDYNNDINSRSAAINYLSAGSVSNPNTFEETEGLHVPLDMTVAFHTDAGVRTDDSFVGSLSVYMTDFNNGKTGAGLDRYVSRDLSSLFLNNLAIDLQKYHWQVRQLWNRNYGEARVPLTPVCILEMLSHQNFADMRLAYDPHFKFDLSRSVYKTMVKYLASLYRRDYVIQPLPVSHFAIQLNERRHTATLSWSPVSDPLEPTAKPKEYIVYTRRGYQGFDNGTIVKGTEYTVSLLPDEVYAFRVAALNEGGESFPSEELACGISSRNKGTVLVVNGFNRLEGPKVIDTPSYCGFDLDADPGVPYGAYTGFCGRQHSFDRSKAGSEASDGLGMSGDELEGQVFMGNTFDYPSLHGQAIMLTHNHSFTSCSEEALHSGHIALANYPIVDLIYGTQKVFNSRTNTMIEHYFRQGGKLLISAANPGGPSVGGTVTTQLPVLMSASEDSASASTLNGCGLTFNIHRLMNAHSYCVPSPSVLSPATNTFPILTYADGSFAAVAQQGKLVRLGFPLESITEHKKMNALMQAFLTFLE